MSCRGPLLTVLFDWETADLSCALDSDQGSSLSQLLCTELLAEKALDAVVCEEATSTENTEDDEEDAEDE